jgi:hypothetical protein
MRCRSTKCLSVGLTSFMASLLVLPLSAQVLTGVVVDASTRRPLPAVLVTLVDAEGRDRVRFLVDSDGAFQFLLPTPGVYSVRAERLGADTKTLPGIAVGVGDTVAVRIPTTVRPIALDGIEVSGDQRCDLPQDAVGQTQRVWEEARKVLALASLTDSLTWYRYDLVKYRRELDPRSMVVRGETRSRRSSSNRQPIGSRPIELLADSGFVVQGQTGDRYYGPDADVLLSNQFLQTHCISLRTGEGDDAGFFINSHWVRAPSFTSQICPMRAHRSVDLSIHRYSRPEHRCDGDRRVRHRTRPPG